MKSDQQSAVTADRLREVLDYNPATGAFIWNVATSPRVKVGEFAGCTRKDGYNGIQIDGRPYLAHRLAWLWVYGVWPVDQIDHINENKGDNRFVNLREATHAQNQQNVLRPRITNPTGHRGVSWCKRDQRWQARIEADGRRRSLGYYDTPQEASVAYLAAKAVLHPFSTRVSA